METPQFYTLKQVADSIQVTLANRYAQAYWILAEMHKLNPTKKGHCYPELIHREDGEILAEMRANIWANNFVRIKQKFESSVGEMFSEGRILLFQAKITFNQKFGLSLEIIDIDPSYTLGNLQRERIQTIEKLQKAGIFNNNQLMEMPVLPKRLAVISQLASKGYSDFNILIQNKSIHFTIQQVVIEATLQGDAAVASILTAFDKIEKFKEHFDAVVIIRGGGAETGMHCYNNYHLAHRLATFPLPVITGIGHSTNQTVCELISYFNGITPSDTAYYFIDYFNSIFDDLQNQKERLKSVSRFYLQNETDKFSTELKDFKQVVFQNIERKNFIFTNQLQNFQHQIRNALFTKNQNLLRKKDLLTNELKANLVGKNNELDHTILNTKNAFRFQKVQSDQTLGQQKMRLELSLKNTLSNKLSLLQSLEKQVELSDPYKILERGFSIISNEKGVISEKNPAKEEDVLQVRSSKETFNVKKIKK